MKTVGKPLPRKDTRQKLSGEALYSSEFHFPGTLYSKMVLSRYANAKIVNIDTSKALNLDGVIVVVTGKDFQDIGKLGIYVGDRDIIAIDRVIWVGQPVAVVVARTETIAEEAATLIDIQYDPLPAIIDPIEAARPDCKILVHPELGSYQYLSAFNPQPGTNLANIFTLKKGDIQQGLQEADHVIEGKYSMPQVSHAYMEPISVSAHYKSDGTVEVVTSAQSPFTVRYLTSIALGIPLHKIQIKVPFIGGGFGGKAGLTFEPLIILLSKFAGNRPVKLVLTREENFLAAAIRVGFHAHIKTGIRNDGRITAQEIEYIVDAGANADYACNVGRAAGYSAIGPYDIENVKAISKTVYTNKPFATAFRGFGHMELHFAIERQMDRIAKAISIDPVKLRHINSLKPGKSRTGTNHLIREDAGSVDECLDAVANEFQWDQSKNSGMVAPGIYRGRGLSIFMKGPAQPPNAGSSAIIKFNEDGSLTLSVGTTEMGQGTVSALAQIAAEILSVPFEKIVPLVDRDTHTTAYTWQTVGSRSLFMDGRATIAAAEDALIQLLNLAAVVLKVSVEDLTYNNEIIWIIGHPQKSITYSDLVSGYMYPDSGESIGGPIIGRGNYIATGMTFLDSETGEGNPAIFETFGCQGCDIEVNILTGEIKIQKLISAFDIGQVINPSLVDGQIYGGVVMAQSIAVNEIMQYSDDGQLLNPNLTDYKIIRAGDIPESQVRILIENPQADGPFGARGIGEITMLGVPAALANALENALGVEFNHLPLNPENVWRTIKEQKPDLIEEALKSFELREGI
ncbi:MAG: xanthine dehydrogenase family protein molybdopterin-binding subunit [Candidatus Hodarchaeales archaeon]